MAPTCTAVNMVASPPRKRCRSSVHAGLGRCPNALALLEMARPHTTDAVSSAHAMSPAARAMYQGNAVVDAMRATIAAVPSATAPPKLRVGWERWRRHHGRLTTSPTPPGLRGEFL